jgi:3alpha(or 20beta)-hydroxysteroid dehydrogenase
MGRLDGKVALITGAARGTGLAISRRFVYEGATVLMADVRDAEGEGAARALGPGATYRHLDVTEEEGWRTVVEHAVGELGGVDVLVNNAAVLHLAELRHTTVDAYLRVIRVNELGTFLGIRSVIDVMSEAGGGSIINISSIDGCFVSALTSAYSASKFAVRGLTKVAALELGRFGIRVNAICPEAGNPTMVAEALSPELIESLRNGPAKGWSRTPPVGRAGTSEDVAGAALFLASADSGFCSGVDLMLDGGTSAGMFSL